MRMNCKIRKAELLAIIFIILFTKPTIVDITSWMRPINYLYDLFRIVLMITIPFAYLLKGHYSFNIILLSLLYISLTFSTLMNSGNIRSIILEAGNVITCCMFAEMSIDKHGFSFISAIKKVLFIYISFNMITMMLFPGGWYISGRVNPENWFLGNKNLFVMFLILYLFCVFEDANINEKKISKVDFFGVVISTLTALFSKSSTCIVGVGTFFIIYYIKKNIKGMVSATTGFIATIIMFFLIVVFNLTKLFAILIVYILRKDLSLTVRTFIWEKALEWFKTSPIYGVGIQFTVNAERNLFGYSHPHCTYLHFLLFGGIIAFILFMAFLLLNVNKLDKLPKRYSIASISAIWSIMVIWIVEVYSRPELLFLVFIISQRLPKFLEKKDCKYRLE